MESKATLVDVPDFGPVFEEPEISNPEITPMQPSSSLGVDLPDLGLDDFSVVEPFDDNDDLPIPPPESTTRPLGEILDEEFPGEFHAPGSTSHYEFLQKMGSDVVAGPLVGLVEKMGLVPDGFLTQLEEEHKAYKKDFIADQKPVSRISQAFAPWKNRKAFAAATTGAAYLIPLVPGGVIAKFGTKALLQGGKLGRGIAKGAGTVKGFLRGAGLAAPEAAVIAFGDSERYGEGEKNKIGFQNALLGIGLGGVVGGAVGRKLGSINTEASEIPEIAQFLSQVNPRDITEPQTLKRLRDVVVRELSNAMDASDEHFIKAYGFSSEGEDLVQNLRITGRRMANPVNRHTELFVKSKQAFEPTGESFENILADTGKVPLDDLAAAVEARLTLEAFERGSHISRDSVTKAEKVFEALGQHYGIDDATQRINFIDDLTDRVSAWQKRAIVLPLRSVEMLEPSIARDLSARKFSSLAELRDTVLTKAERSEIRGKNVSSYPILEEMAMISMRVSNIVDRQLVKRAAVEAYQSNPDLFPRSYKLLEEGRLNKKKSVTLPDGTVVGGDQHVPGFAFKGLKKAESSADLVDEDASSIFFASDKIASSESFITYKIVNGTRVRVVAKFGKDLADSLNYHNPFTTNMFMKASQAFNRSLRTGATTLATGFVLRNPLRDQFAAWINSENGFIPVLDPVISLMEILAEKTGATKNQFLEEFRAHGIMGSSLVGLDRAALESNLVGAKTRGAIGTVRHFLNETGRNPLYPLQLLSELSEASTRFAEFRLARKGGRLWGKGKPKSVLRAAREASEVSVNFSRGGKFIRGVNTHIPFVNAEFQDIIKFTRNLRDPEKRVGTIARSVAGITVPTLITWARFRNDKDYQQLRPEEKRNFIHYHKNEDGSFLKVPRPLGINNALWGETILAFVEFIDGKDPKLGDRIASAFAEETPLGYAFDPVNKVAGNLPTIISPLVQNAAGNAGYNFYFKREVVDKRLQDELPKQQFNASTPRSLIEIAEYLSPLAGSPGDPSVADQIGITSPLKLQNLLRGWTGTLGMDFARAADVVGNLAPATSPDPRVGSNTMPFFGGVSKVFTTKAPPYGFATAAVGDFYTLLDSALEGQKIKEDLKRQLVEKKLSPEEYQERLTALFIHQPEALIVDELRKKKRFLADLGKQRRNLAEAGGLERHEKWDALVRMDQIVSTTMITAMETYALGLTTLSMNLSGTPSQIEENPPAESTTEGSNFPDLPDLNLGSEN